MGNMTAIDTRAWAGNEDGLRHHLRYNHYPPVDLDFVPAAKQAIQQANDDNWDDEIVLPNGHTARVHEIIQGLHLDAFLGDDLARECELDVDESDEAPEGDTIIG